MLRVNSPSKGKTLSFFPYLGSATGAAHCGAADPHHSDAVVID